jgi:hypothetical protein
MLRHREVHQAPGWRYCFSWPQRLKRHPDFRCRMRGTSRQQHSHLTQARSRASQGSDRRNRRRRCREWRRRRRAIQRARRTRRGARWQEYKNRVGYRVSTGQFLSVDRMSGRGCIGWFRVFSRVRTVDTQNQLAHKHACRVTPAASSSTRCLPWPSRPERILTVSWNILKFPSNLEYFCDEKTPPEELGSAMRAYRLWDQRMELMTRTRTKRSLAPRVDIVRL